jgi:hypothetical protein
VKWSSAIVAEGTPDGRLDRREAGRVRLAVDLDHLPGLGPRILRRVVEVDRLQQAAPVADHGQDRVGEQVDGKSSLRAHHAERVDQEGHVVGDDHDDRVRRDEAVAPRLRVEDANPGLAAGPHATELELRERGACEVLRGALHEVELRHAVVEAACEPVRGDRHPTAALAARERGNAVDDRLSGGGNSA